MSHRRKFNRLVALLFLSILVVGCIYLLISRQSTLQFDLTRLNVELNELAAQQKKLGKFDTQNVDTYISRLNSKVKFLKQGLTVLDFEILNHGLLGLEVSKAELETRRDKLKSQLDRYKLDQQFMQVSRLDWILIRQRPLVLEAISVITKKYSELSFGWQQLVSGQSFDNTPYYVKQGQIIGLQGCSGVCTGTHLHFVVAEDNIAVDPCPYLPTFNLSRWGYMDSCGVDDEAELMWPLLYPWIMTQTYGNHSPVTNDGHNALDIIDREFAPVMAAHDGWYYPEFRECRGTVCNNGGAYVASVCADIDCRSGLKTEYWHLDWVVALPQTEEEED